MLSKSHFSSVYISLSPGIQDTNQGVPSQVIRFLGQGSVTTTHSLSRIYFLCGIKKKGRTTVFQKKGPPFSLLVTTPKKKPYKKL